MRGQSLSLDALVATFLFLFIVVLGITYGINVSTGDFASILDREAGLVSEHLAEELSVQIRDRVEIDTEAFLRYMADGYAGLRDELGLRSDFCIFLENETGGVVSVFNGSGIEPAAFGSGHLQFFDGSTTIVCD